MENHHKEIEKTLTWVNKKKFTLKNKTVAVKLLSFYFDLLKCCSKYVAACLVLTHKQKVGLGASIVQ